MTSNRPYLIRAIHEWITDNAMTPLIVVDATMPGVEVPAAYVRDGRVLLNVSVDATKGLELGNETIRFSARFGGVARRIALPTHAVLAIFARENDVGLAFPEQEAPEAQADPDKPTAEKRPRPSLRVVK